MSNVTVDDAAHKVLDVGTEVTEWEMTSPEILEILDTYSLIV